jgi:hypothetical protein
MANSAGTVGAPNGGKTDMERGMTSTARVTKAQRKTGTIAPLTEVPNQNTEDGNARTVSDPRLS